MPQLAVSHDGELLALARGMAPDFGASGRRKQSNRVVLIRTRDFSVVANNLESLPEVGGISTGGLFFTPDSQKLVLESASASSPGLAHLTLWDVSTLQRLEEPVVIPLGVQFLGFARASQRMVLGTAADGRSRLLDVSLTPEMWAGAACQLAGDALTRDEWTRYVSRELEYRPACVQGKFEAPTASQF